MEEIIEKITLKVEGLHCSHETTMIEKSLVKLVESVKCDVINKKVIVTFDKNKISSKEICLKLKKAGFKPKLFSDQQSDAKYLLIKNLLTILSGVFLIIGASFEVTKVHFFQDLLATYTTPPIPLDAKIFYVISILLVLSDVIPKAYYSIKLLKIDIHLLLIIALIGALIIDQWFEATTLAFLFSVSIRLEDWSMRKAKKATQALMDLKPLIARRINGDEVPIEKIVVGDEILVHPFEEIPIDAEVFEGDVSIDESSLTGESLPVDKTIGDPVFAGTLNGDSSIKCKVLRVIEDTALFKMIALVEEAASKQTKKEQWVEKFAKYYTPAMILFALLVMFIPPMFSSIPFVNWFYRGLVVLVIACPCALVISTPIAVVAGLTKAARNGVLIKGGTYLELMGQIEAVCLDKTGTITQGKPQVVMIVRSTKMEEDKLVRIAASLEMGSNHPLAKAVLKESSDRNLVPMAVTDFTVVKGKGARGDINGETFYVGSHRYLHEKEIEGEELHRKILELEDAGHTIIALFTEKEVLGIFCIADAIRDNAAESVASFHNEGIKEVMMLTGDNEKTASMIAKKVGIDTYFANQLPEEKLKKVTELQKHYKHVAMIGDGVNDAPSMAVASCGIAMGEIGTDVAIETADIALMNDDLSKIPWLIKLSRKTVRTIKQNIAFAMGLKICFLVLGVMGIANLWMAVLVDTGAALLVVFNGLSLLRNSKKEKKIRKKC